MNSRWSGMACLGAVLGLLVATDGCDLEAQSADARGVRLQVPGRASAMPFVASKGDVVLVVWAASDEGLSDLYAARSTDGGRTFPAPVRVNDQGLRQRPLGAAKSIAPPDRVKWNVLHHGFLCGEVPKWS